LTKDKLKYSTGTIVLVHVRPCDWETIFSSSMLNTCTK